MVVERSETIAAVPMLGHDNQFYGCASDGFRLRFNPSYGLVGGVSDKDKEQPQDCEPGNQSSGLALRLPGNIVSHDCATHLAAGSFRIEKNPPPTLVAVMSSEDAFIVAS
jgi:hypothetical protein